MIAILSPAKNMTPTAVPGLTPTRPAFPQKTEALVRRLCTYSAAELESLMGINPKLAMGACIKYREFDEERGTPALATYRGLAFTNIGPEDFTADDYAYAGDHLRIISALYGLLRPTDAIRPYRLEMQCRLDMGEPGHLYGYWGDDIYRSLFAPGETVVNLASQEYVKVLTPNLSPLDRMVTCRFLVYRDGKYRTLATEAKMCRGQMVRYMVRNRLRKPRELTAFTWNGYRYIAGMSGETVYSFVKLA